MPGWVALASAVQSSAQAVCRRVMAAAPWDDKWSAAPRRLPGRCRNPPQSRGTGGGSARARMDPMTRQCVGDGFDDVAGAASWLPRGFCGGMSISSPSVVGPSKLASAHSDWPGNGRHSPRAAPLPHAPAANPGKAAEASAATRSGTVWHRRRCLRVCRWPQTVRIHRLPTQPLRPVRPVRGRL